MIENRCPPGELLSAYVDREANPSEERRVDLHLSDCGACRARVRSLGRLKVAVRNQPLPPMPAQLRADLLRLAREAQARADGSWRTRLKAAFEALAGRVASPGWAAAAAVALLALAWGGQRLGGHAPWLGGPARTVVPVDFVLAAHNEYARTMPLAATEMIMAELPVQISSVGVEETVDVY